MEGYQLRVISERSDLMAKINSLNEYLSTPTHVEGLLIIQLEAMRTYLACLDVRIKAF